MRISFNFQPFFQLDLSMWPWPHQHMKVPFFISINKFGSNRTSTFQRRPKKQVFNFQPFFQLDLRWPLTSVCDLDLINIWRFPLYIHKPSLVPIRLQLFKRDSNNENQIFSPNLTSDDPWPWYVTLDLINIWRNPYCIFDRSLVVIGLKLFKGDLNNENLT